jgi:hypothetical protein
MWKGLGSIVFVDRIDNNTDSRFWRSAQVRFETRVALLVIGKATQVCEASAAPPRNGGVVPGYAGEKSGRHVGV